MAAVALLALALLPEAAWACATCVSSAYGDRTFNWAFLGLILMPFVVALGIAAVFAARHYAARRRPYEVTGAAERRGAGAPPFEAPHEIVGAAERRGAGAPPFEQSLQEESSL
jgi:hypothetical protein